MSSNLARGVLDTTLWDKVNLWLAAVRWFSPGTPVSFINKTDCHDINEILLKVALNTTTLTPANMIIQTKLQQRWIKVALNTITLTPLPETGYLKTAKGTYI